MAKCLVIGGNGFLGSHLVDTLAAAGHAVTAFDRFSNETQNFTSFNVIPLAGDFLDKSHLAQAVVGQEFVFHFLSVTTPATAESDPTLDIRTNLVQTVDLFKACSEAGVRRVFFASSGGAVYGAHKDEASTEMDPTWPVSPYGIVKLAIENYLRYFKVTRGLEHTIFRISNPYGPRQGPTKAQGLIPVVLNRIAQGLPITRFGDGTMIRDFVYVDDLMRMIRMALDERAPHDVYNLGHGEGHSVNEILESVRRVTGRDFEIIEKPSPPTFIQRSVLDISRFNDDFGPICYTDLDDGIRSTWERLPAYSELLV